MKQKKEKYSEGLKKIAGDLFSQKDSKGKRIYRGKKLASELGVSLNTAYYLEYSGRSLLGILPEKKSHSPRTKSEKNVQESVNFVENNIFDEDTRSGQYSAVGVYLFILATFAVVALSTIGINRLIDIYIGSN